MVVNIVVDSVDCNKCMVVSIQWIMWNYYINQMYLICFVHELTVTVH